MDILIRAEGFGKRSEITEYRNSLTNKTKVTLAYNTAWINIYINGRYFGRLIEGSIWVNKISKVEYIPLTHNIEIYIYAER